MELVSKKKLHALRGPGQRGALAARSPNASRSRSATSSCRTFANGELYCRYGESIRGADVFVVQSHCEPINDRIMEQLIMIDAAKRASAKRITAVVPVLRVRPPGPQGRGPRADHRPPVADLLTVAGADRVVTVDLHTGQIQGFFDFPVDHLTAVPLLAEYLADERRAATSPWCRPTPAALKLARRFANHLGDAGVEAELAFIDKRRPKGTHNVAEAIEVVGEVAGPGLRAGRRHDRHRGHDRRRRRRCSWTGAPARSWVAATHGVLSGPAVDRLKNAPIREVVVTNTLPIPDRQAVRHPPGALDRPDHRRGARRRVRGHQRQRDLPRRQRLGLAPVLSVSEPPWSAVA